MKNMHVVMATILLGDGKSLGTSAAERYSAGPRPSETVGSRKPEPKPTTVNEELEKNFAALDAAVQRSKSPSPDRMATEEIIDHQLKLWHAILTGRKLVDAQGNHVALCRWNATEEAWYDNGILFPVALKEEPSPETRPTTIPEPKKERRLVPRLVAFRELMVNCAKQRAWSFDGKEYRWNPIYVRVEQFDMGSDVWRDTANVPDCLYLDPPETT